MKKFALLSLFGGACLLAMPASAVTVLNTTQGEVKAQCAGQTDCTTACGSTLCHYVCTTPATQCTVAIFVTKRQGGRPVVVGSKLSAN